MMALYNIHLSLAEMHNEGKQFAEEGEGGGFLLVPRFMAFNENKTVAIHIPELMASPCISLDDFTSFWQMSQPLMERYKIEEEKCRYESPNGQKYVRLDPAHLRAATFDQLLSSPSVENV
jgi:hypothetical protein